MTHLLSKEMQKDIDFICDFLWEIVAEKVEIYHHPLFVVQHSMINFDKIQLPTVKQEKNRHYYKDLVSEKNKEAILIFCKNLVDLIHHEFNKVIDHRNQFIRSEYKLYPHWIARFKDNHDMNAHELLELMIEKVLEAKEDDDEQKMPKIMMHYVNDLLNMVYQQNRLFEKIEEDLKEEWA